MGLQDLYKEQVIPQLKTEFALKNAMAVPRITKVVVDMGIGEAATNKEILNKELEGLSLITGQRPEIRGAKMDIAGFGIRRGAPVGLRATLRGRRLWEFLEKLFRVVLPRIRDFRGVKASGFDGKGNYTLGLPDNAIFPEIDAVRVSKSRGLGITIVTTAKNDKEAKRLLEELGMLFEKSDKQ